MTSLWFNASHCLPSFPHFYYCFSFYTLSFVLFLLKTTFTVIFKIDSVEFAITVVPIFSPFLLLHQHPHSLRPSPHRWSCPWVMGISSLATPFPVLYFISLWLFCNYLLVLLNPLTSSPIPLLSPSI